MARSRKYGQNGKTFHVPYSKGTDSTDRKNWEYWDNIVQGVAAGAASYKTTDIEDGTTVENTSVPQDPIQELVFTEKLDGGNICLNEFGVFARSHATPTDHSWNRNMVQMHPAIQKDLKENNLEIFGENLFATHSIQYLRIPSYYFVFGIRQKDKWLSWEETCEWAELFDFPMVPVIARKKVSDFNNQEELQSFVQSLMGGQSAFGSIDASTMELDQHEGVVFRNVEEYHVNNFIHNLFKIVRKGHVKTDEHWTKNWKVAPREWELQTLFGEGKMSDQDCIEMINKFNQQRNQ